MIFVKFVGCVYHNAWLRLHLHSWFVCHGMTAVTWKRFQRGLPFIASS
jgi:hypothetical protein